VICRMGRRSVLGGKDITKIGNFVIIVCVCLSVFVIWVTLVTGTLYAARSALISSSRMLGGSPLMTSRG